MNNTHKHELCRLLNGDITPGEISEIFGLEYTNGIYRIKGRKRTPNQAVIPTEEEFIKFWNENGYDPQVGLQAYKGYIEDGWRDANGKPIVNWKSKCRKVWFTNLRYKVKEIPKEKSKISVPKML